MAPSLREGRTEPTMPAGKGYPMRGAGDTEVAISGEALWAVVLDETRLAAAIPGAETLHRLPDEPIRVYAADVPIGVGPLKGTYRVRAEFQEERPPGALVLFGGARGPFGKSWGEGWVDIAPTDAGCRIHYAYAILIEGPVARMGGRLLDAAANRLIDKFFKRLAAAADTLEAKAR